MKLRDVVVRLLTGQRVDEPVVAVIVAEANVVQMVPPTATEPDDALMLASGGADLESAGESV